MARAKNAPKNVSQLYKDNRRLSSSRSMSNATTKSHTNSQSSSPLRKQPSSTPKQPTPSTSKQRTPSTSKQQTSSTSEQLTPSTLQTSSRLQSPSTSRQQSSSTSATRRSQLDTTTSRRKAFKPKKRLACINLYNGRTELTSAKTLQSIRYLQNTTKFCIPKVSFSRVVKEIMFDVSADVHRITELALQAIQEASEMVIVHLLSNSNLLASHANRKTIFPKDMAMVALIQRT